MSFNSRALLRFSLHRSRSTQVTSPHNSRHIRLESTTKSVPADRYSKASTPNQPNKEDNPPKKTIAQLDEEVRQKLEGSSGGGGEARLELENGKPVAMKRGVKENMFRLI